MNREQLAQAMFDVFFGKAVEAGEADIEDKPDWNENCKEAEEGREAFRAMADLAIANRLDLGKG
jgi:hypothetical protein